jgi:dTDP-4-amino-4,6-dideoxygalactose transaminase
MNKVAFVDLYQQHQEVEEELTEVFRRVLQNSSFILGPEVVAFEQAFAAYIGAAECIAVNNGTTALQLVLEALEIGPGDQVITVVNTFIATAEAISAVGAKPVLVVWAKVAASLPMIRLWHKRCACSATTAL